MRLIIVELKRLWSRRLVWITAFGLLAILTLPVLQAFEDSKPPSKEDQANSQLFYEQSLESWQENGEADLADCLEQEAAEELATGVISPGYVCDHIREPVMSDHESWYQPFPDASDSALSGVSGILIFAGLLIGASFISAEIGTGALGNWLTFEPRRTRVFFSKVAAVALGVVPIAVACLLFLEGGLALVYSMNGALGSVPGAMWLGILWTGLRVIALTMMGAVGGLALGTLTKHTAAALGVAISYMIVVESMIVGGVSDAFNRFQGWLVSFNLAAFSQNGLEYSYQVCEPQSGLELMCTEVEKHISGGSAAVYLLTLLAVFVLAAWLVFRRRDVN